MAHPKISLPCRLIGLIALLLVASQALAFEPRWMTYTSFLDVRRVRQFNDTTYFVTSGGLMAVHDVAQPPVTYTNVDGLGTVDLTDLIRDESGRTWISAMGRLIKFNGAASTSYMFFDNDGRPFRLHCIADDGDLLWLGTEKGLVLFSKTNDGGQIEDSYQLFGNLNPNPAVYDVMLRGDSILIATSAGVAIGDKSNRTLLKAPANWSTYGATSYPELGTDTVRRVASFEGSLYFGTVKGLFRLDRAPSDTLVRVAEVDTNRVNDLRVDVDTLFVYHTGDLTAIANGNVSDVESFHEEPAYTGINTGSSRWIASGAGYLIFHDFTLGVTNYPYVGFRSNDLCDVAVAPDGLIGLLFTGSTFMEFRMPTWEFWGSTQLNPFANNVRIAPSSRANFWIGTFGAGLYQLFPMPSHRWDTTGTTLQGNPDGRNYVVIPELELGDGYLFAACYRAYRNEPIAIGEIANDTEITRWTAIGQEQGLTNTFVNSLDYFAGRVSVGTESNGLYECYLNGDPFSGTATCTRYSEESGNLISNTVRVVKYAPDSTLWAGTNFGLSQWDRGTDRFRDIALPAGFGPDITTMEFDSRGNLWLGAANGLARRDATTGDIQVFTTMNSGLVNDVIRAIYFDSLTSDVYIATAGGLSRIPGSLGPPTLDVASVLAFPNPFVISSAADRLNFNYARSGTVRIFTMAGELVIEQSVNQSWDGRNSDGADVASGVYLFVLNADDGTVGRGKFLLVRK